MAGLLESMLPQHTCLASSWLLSSFSWLTVLCLSPFLWLSLSFSLSLMHEGSRWRCQGMFTPCSKCLPLPATSLSLSKLVSLYDYKCSLFLLFIWCGICVRVQVKGHGCVYHMNVFKRVWVNMFVRASRGQRLVSVVSLNHFWKQDLLLNMQIISWLGCLAICLASTLYPVLGLQVSTTTPSICTGTGDQTQVLMLSQHAGYL